MSIVTRTTKAGEKRHYARIHRGGGRYDYGPARSDKEEAKRDEARLVLKPKRRDKSAAALCDWFLETYPHRPRPRTNEKPRGSTVATMKNAIRPFRETFGARRPSDIPREELKDWVALHHWAAPAVRTMFMDALDSGLIDHNPLAGIPFGKSRGRRDIVVPTLEEIHDLADCAEREHGEYGPTFRAMVLFFAYTCLRPGEVFTLERGDLDGDMIHVRRNLGRTGDVTAPKNHQPRTVILPDAARQALASMPRALHSDLVFTAKRGGRFTEGALTYYWAAVRSAFLTTLEPVRRRQLDPPGTRFVPYSLRHFGATYMLDVLELDEFTVSIQMGHTDGGKLVRQVYGHRSHEAARERLRRAWNAPPVTELRSTERGAENG
jgi:integrase